MSDDYRPMMPPERADALARWHEEASVAIHALGHHRVEYLGLDLVVPEHVFPPAPMSQLLGRAVLDEVRATDRVLDMGTGCGVNAILAASLSVDVTGVDVNPHAVSAAIANAKRNGVAERTHFVESDVFSRVDGTFDLIVFDPPFRWFAPRDLLELAFTDENYAALTRFMSGVADRLRPGGRLLLFFGTSGDLTYLRTLIASSGLACETIASRELERGGLVVDYHTFRLCRQG
jgi:release factor glutamine methyltransferase